MTMKKAAAEFIGTFVLVFFACGVAALTVGALAALLYKLLHKTRKKRKIKKMRTNGHIFLTRRNGKRAE